MLPETETQEYVYFGRTLVEVVLLASPRNYGAEEQDSSVLRQRSIASTVSVEGQPEHHFLQNHRDLSPKLTHSLGGLQRNGYVGMSAEITVSV